MRSVWERSREPGGREFRTASPYLEVSQIAAASVLAWPYTASFPRVAFCPHKPAPYLCRYHPSSLWFMALKFHESSRCVTAIRPAGARGRGRDLMAFEGGDQAAVRRESASTPREAKSATTMSGCIQKRACTP